MISVRNSDFLKAFRKSKLTGYCLYIFYDFMELRRSVAVGTCAGKHHLRFFLARSSTVKAEKRFLGMGCHGLSSTIKSQIELHPQIKFDMSWSQPGTEHELMLCLVGQLVQVVQNSCLAPIEDAVR